MIFFLPNYILNVLATTDRIAWNYGDEYPETAWKINDNTYGDMENLRVTYNMGEGTCIVRGVRYKYNNVGSGPTHDVELQFDGDYNYVFAYDTGIPHVTIDSWRTFRISGPAYLLDDDPVINFIGMDPSDNCISLCADDPSNGHSYYDVGSGWVLDSGYEYIAELIYEWIPTLNVNISQTGSLTSTDNVDAYFLNLSTNNKYSFILNRTSGAGNFNMKLYTDKDTTDELLTQSSGTTFSKSMDYIPTSSDTYVLIIEAVNAGTDIADYSISYYTESLPVADFTANQTNINVGDCIQFNFTGNLGDPPTTFQWNFGDDSTNSSLQDPIHQYNSPGTFTVGLLVKDNNNNMDYEVKANYIQVGSSPLPQIPFIIDDMGNGNYTWTEMANQNWCSGSGTSNNPYILQDLLIEGNNISNCIEIRNSKKFFQLLDCEFEQSLYTSNNAGIKMVNVSNGIFSNNTCSYNGNGIILIDCYNITILNNEIYDNGWDGIQLNNCHNITIRTNKNSIDSNERAGIYLLLSSYNNITDNSIEHSQYGIYLYESSFNQITYNEFYRNSKNIIEINCVDNVIENNLNLSSQHNIIQFNFDLFLIIISLFGALAVLIFIISRIGRENLRVEEKEENLKIPLKQEHTNLISESVSQPSIEQKFKVFLSFSFDDYEYFNLPEIAKKLKKYEELDQVFYCEDERHQNVVELMEQALQESNIFILFCSENSEKSRYFKDQWQVAFQLQKQGLMKIIPVYENEKYIPYMLRPILNVKFTKDNFDGFIQNLYKEILRD